MAPVAWPSSVDAPSEFAMWLEFVEQVNRAPFSGVFEVTPRYGIWRALMTWPIKHQTDVGPIQAILARGRGHVQSLQVPIWSYRKLVGSSPGTGLTLDAVEHPAGTNTVTTTGTGGLAPGDLIQIRLGTPRIHQVVDGTGPTYTVEPELRHTYAALDTTNIRTLADGFPLYLTMVLPGDGHPQPAAFPSPLDATSGQLSRSFTVEFVEGLNRADMD